MSAPDLTINNLFNVKDKIVLVTGGGSGIGEIIAAGFAQNGAKVYIAARTEAQLKSATEELSRMSSIPVQYITANVGSRAGCDALIVEFKRRENKVHILVNNSGIAWGGPYNDFPEEKGWDDVFSVNVKSVFYMTAGLTDLLSKGADNRDPGRVINISSTSSLNPQAERLQNGSGTWSYHASKAAVNHLTSELALKLGPHHITVNAILPGVFPSKMTAGSTQIVGEDAFMSGLLLGRMGTPRDMAGLALFLASPASAHITGTHTLLDGGARYGHARLTASTKL